MMKNILITTDFSKNAQNATQYALQLFKNETCIFHLLNTYTPAIAHSRFMAQSFKGNEFSENEGSSSETALKNEIRFLESKYHNPLHRFRPISSFDVLTNKVVETIAAEDIDMVVSGTKGASGYKQVFMGTNTVRLIKSVKGCSIIAVPENYEFRPPKHIAFPTDFKHNFSADVLNPLIRIAQEQGSEIHVMHIDEEKQRDKFQESNRYTLMEYLAPVSHNVHFMPDYSCKSNVIARFLKELKIDMLALVYNEHNYLARLIREPVVTNMAYNGEIPLLVLPS